MYTYLRLMDALLLELGLGEKPIPRSLRLHGHSS